MRLFRDAQFALRTLSRTPTFTLVAVLTLAFGIGASAAIFSIVHAVVLRPLDYREPASLLRITSELRTFGATDTGVTAGELADYQQRGDLFEGVAGQLPIGANVTGGDVPERLEMLLVSWNYFDVLGVAPARGRAFTREDDVPGVANVAVISDAFWRRRLGADPGVVGTTIVIDRDPIQVVGIMPAGFAHPGRTLEREVDAWSPSGFRSASGVRSRRRLEGALARLQPGVTLEEAQAKLADLGATLSRQFPSDYPAQDGWQPRLVPLQQDVVRGVATPMFVLLGGVGLLLIVACVNVAHLVLARSTARRQELAVRLALGATRGRLVLQLASESAVLALAASVAGVLVASWMLRALVSLAPSRVPRLHTVGVDAMTMVFAAGVCVFVTAIFTALSGWQVRRLAGFATLKDGTTGRSTDGRATRVRDGLVIAEVAVATVLLVLAGLFVRTVTGLLSVPTGFESANLVTARMTLPRPNDTARAEYLDPARRAAFASAVLERVSALPGVESAALSSQIPMGGFNPPLFVETEGSAPGGRRPVAHLFQVSPRYFDTMRVPLVSGRGFAASDRAGAEQVAIVSETMARGLWRGQQAVGQRLRLGPASPWITVIGVAGDVLNRRLTEAPQPILYRPIEQSSELGLALLVRTSTRGETLAESLPAAVRAVDGGVPLYGVRPMTELLERAVGERRFLMRLLAVFGIAATGLALLGIYGVMAYSVSQRTREIGIRMAIGARQADVSRLVLTRGLSLTGGGVGAGLVLSLLLARLVASQLFGVRPADPLTMISVLFIMGVVAAAAAWLPARRAARVDPMTALRSL